MKAVSLAWSCEMAVLIEEHHGSVSSWGREERYNALVGGSVDPPSRHVDWEALDPIFLSEEDREAFFAEVIRRGYHGQLYPVEVRGGISTFRAHIQRVAPRER